MPSQVRIISQRNSYAWDELVGTLIDGNLWEQEQTYGGCTSEARADDVRKKVRTAARRAEAGSKVFWKPCDAPGKCSFGADCTHHVYITLYKMDKARSYKARQSQQRR